MAFPRREHISFAVLADSHRVGEHNKVDCFGMFDTLWVWAVPASRGCSIAFGLRDIKPGEMPIAFWFRHGKGKRLQLGTITLQISKASHSAVLAHRIPLPITRLGQHEVGISIGSRAAVSSTLWIPLLVQSLKWPKRISEPELSRLLSDPHTIKGSRAELVCETCGTKYVFEAFLDPNKELDRGSLPFPKDGIFTCGKCGRVHYLKDIEGQVISRLGQSAPGAVT